MRSGLPASYDDWKINGSWHRCACGARWSDSDGGPCCKPCTRCENPVKEGDDENGLCQECAKEPECKGCGDYIPIDKLDKDGFCPECQQNNLKNKEE